MSSLVFLIRVMLPSWFGCLYAIDHLGLDLWSRGTLSLGSSCWSELVANLLTLGQEAKNNKRLRDLVDPPIGDRRQEATTQYQKLRDQKENHHLLSFTYLLLFTRSWYNNSHTSDLGFHLASYSGRGIGTSLFFSLGNWMAFLILSLYTLFILAPATLLLLDRELFS